MKKILITVLCIIMLFITIIQIRNTFALYKAEVTGEIQSLLGVWSIKINETDISSGGTDVKFNITEDYLHFTETSNVAEGFIAPGSEGYFEVLIDATETDVAVRYDIKIDDVATIKIGEDTSDLDEKIVLKVTGVEDVFEKDGEIDTTTEHINYIDVDNKTVSGVIPINIIESKYKDKVRVYFKWINDDNNNIVDTMLGNGKIGNRIGYSFGSNRINSALIERTEAPKIVVPVSLVVTQYMGESLEMQVATP